jgi:hypothetical protein
MVYDDDMTASEKLIRDYCAKLGISRERFDAEGILQQETIDALLELQASDGADAVIPLGLPGAGKRRSELTDEETEQLGYNEVEFAMLLEESERGRIS